MRRFYTPSFLHFHTYRSFYSYICFFHSIYTRIFYFIHACLLPPPFSFAGIQDTRRHFSFSWFVVSLLLDRLCIRSTAKCVLVCWWYKWFVGSGPCYLFHLTTLSLFTGLMIHWKNVDFTFVFSSLIIGMTDSGYSS